MKLRVLSARAKRDALVLAHRYLVAQIAHKLMRSLPPSYDVDDLISVGTVALLGAAERYLPRAHGGTPFGVFARKGIRGAMIDTARGSRYAESTRPPLEDAPEATSPGRVAEYDIDAERMAAKLRAAVAALPERLRSVVELYYSADELFLADVAARIPTQSGKRFISIPRATQLHREALAELRERLDVPAA